MKQLILLALTVISGLISSFGSDEVLAQISLSCPTQGVLTLSGKFDLITTQQAQCNFTVDNTVPNIGVRISLTTPSLISGQADPLGTNRKAQLSYSNKDGQSIIINEGSNRTDNFSRLTTTTMLLNMQIQRPQQFLAGSYVYGITINITPP